MVLWFKERGTKYGPSDRAIAAETEGEQMQSKSSRRTTTIVEAAKVLGVGRNQAYEAARRRGEIPTIRIGKRLLVPLAALERLLQETA